MTRALSIPLLIALSLGARPEAADGQHWSASTNRVMLDNGLTVLLLQRGELPIVSVQALYRAGSRNEAPGLTGAAHFVEHMAFRSTDGIAKEDMTNQVLRWGGRWNGYTSFDQTVYGSHAPSRHLDWLLHLERERMTRVRFPRDEVERERTSVIAELHQYENSPSYVLVEHRLRRAALVAHPYGSPIMGWISDLEGITDAELQSFYRDFYGPSNLILAIVGRFEREEALALVRKHFGDLPAGGRSTDLRTVEPPQRGARRITMTGPGSGTHVEITVHAPATSDDRYATLLALEGVLAGGKAPGRAAARRGSRLHRALVASGLASRVTTEVEASQYPGLFSIGVEAPPDADVPNIEAALDEVLAAAGRDVTHDEVRLAGGQISAAFSFAADSNRAIANLLSVYEELGSYRLLEEIPRRVGEQTRDTVMAFARERLAPERRSVGVFRPGEGSEGDEDTTQPPAEEAPETGEVPRLPTQMRPPSSPPVVPPLPSPTTTRLPNGLSIAALSMPGETIHVRVRVAAGSVDEPAGREGLSLLTAQLLDAGTRGRDLPVTEALGRLNIRLQQSSQSEDDAFANRHFVDITATMLRDQLPQAAPLIADLMLAPSFPEQAVARTIADLQAVAEGRADDSEWRAARAALSRLYGERHPYGRPVEGTAASLASLTRTDVAAFHQSTYRPERTAIAVAGAIDPRDAIGVLTSAFGRWPDGPAPARRGDLAVPPVAPSGSGGRVQVPMPHKAQASIAVALPGVARRSGDYVPLAALNYLLGETGYAGRLGTVLVDTGLAYAVYASIYADRGPGPMLVTTNAVQSAEVVRRITATLERFARQGVDDASLREAQGFLLGRLLFRFETPAAATDTMAEAALLGAPADLQRFAKAVMALTVKDLSRAAATYYDPARAAIAVAGR